MKNFKILLLEKLKVSTKINSRYVDNLPPSSKEKGEAAYEYLQNRYGHIFDNIRILRSNNVALGLINTNVAGHGMYDDSEFTLYLNTDKNTGYLMRRTIKGTFSSTPAQFIKNMNTLDDLCDKFDQLLTKRGYNVK